MSGAVTLGTDAIMLSGETAVGAYPIDAVKMMDRIARHTEAYLWSQNAYSGRITENHTAAAIPVWEAVANSMVHMAHDMKVRAVLVISSSGMSAATMSSARPAAPVVAITDSKDVCRRMALLWSVIPTQSDMAGKINPNQLAKQVAEENNMVSPGDKVLLVRGFHAEDEMNTPSVTVLTI